MKKQEDFLVEIHTEELPPKSLLKLGEAFCNEICDRLQKADLAFEDIKFFATPRRLAVLVKDLASAQKDQMIERKGPAKSAAFDANGNPTPACAGFAKSLGVLPSELKTIKNAQGEWVGMVQHVPGKNIEEIMPALVEQAALALPIPKRMRWGDNDAQFTRPIHSVIMLYGDKIIEGNILGYPAGRETRGHRFHAPDTYTIFNATEYESLLRDEAHVMADFEFRRSEILNKAREAVELAFKFKANVLIDHALLDEVTGIVEWPTALIGHFDDKFLDLPKEVLISSMQDHQRYFPVVDANQKLMPHFVTISNIESKNPERVIHGNERVLRARLADAAFFYETDKKETLKSRVERLKGIVFQAKLGTMYDKAERISKLAVIIATKMRANPNEAKEAGMLAKTDLATNMVGEFPELQGVMGYYYAKHDGLSNDIATAIREHYLPRYAGDDLPESLLGISLSIADRLDTLLGAFGINQIPTGDKDPYGLRRAAVGVIRVLIEKKISIDLEEVLNIALSNFTMPLENTTTVSGVLNFIQERLRSWYLEQGVTADVFASVAALNIWNPMDINERIKAVQAFRKLPEAETLSIANKRVSNILAKYVDAIEAKAILPDYFENNAEQELARQLEAKSHAIQELSGSGKYDEVLIQLAELKKPVDDFFDQVMVMTDNKPQRENRVLLLSKLRALFLQVADIALLQ